jgi:glycine hydroxymethyltransferase
MDPSGIRIGTPAATTRWMLEPEMKIIASVFTKSIKALQEAKWRDSEIDDKSDMTVFENEKLISKLEELKWEILELCEEFGVYK